MNQPRVHAFSPSYGQARERFLHAASAANCHLDSWEILEKGPRGESLAIDVAQWGDPRARRWLLLTSGLHGTEGLFGSAVQWALLQELQHREPDADIGVLFLHGLNPYGMAWRRRVNEQNIDLNRNFLLPGQEYLGAHPLYQHVYQRFDPTLPPRFHDIFALKAWTIISRHGLGALRQSLPVGQYDFPKGLFFGGQSPAPLQALLRQQLPALLGQPREITHLDFHTGLGRWGEYRLLMDGPASQADAQWYTRYALAHTVEPVSNQQTAYIARGTIGPWMQHHLFPKTQYHYTAAEFGTYGVVRVIKALFEELRAHYSLSPDDPRYQWAKKQVEETFVPQSLRWREQVMHQALDLCLRCLNGLQESAHRSAAELDLK